MYDSYKLGLYKDYIIPQAAEYLCQALNKLLNGKNFYEQEDAAYIRNLLSDYYKSGNYSNMSIRKEVHNKFINKYFPKTMRTIKLAVSKGVVNKKLWMPIIQDFFKKAIQYTNIVPGMNPADLAI